MSKTEQVVNLLKAIETGDSNAFAIVNPNKYIQHNLAIPDGLEGIASVLKSVPIGTFKVNTLRAFQDEDYVVTHTEYDFFGPKVGFDVFRFEGDQVVEHWDNLQEVRPKNKSGRSMTDGFTELKDLDKTEENKNLVKTFFYDNIFLGRNTFGEYMDPNFAQHNPDAADGLTGLGEALEFFMVDNNMKYQTMHKVLGQGNFVLLVCEGVYGPNGGVPTSFFDLFRVENGKIVEHWDALETILPESERKHSNGKFNFPQ